MAARASNSGASCVPIFARCGREGVAPSCGFLGCCSGAGLLIFACFRACSPFVVLFFLQTPPHFAFLKEEKMQKRGNDKERDKKAMIVIWKNLPRLQIYHFRAIVYLWRTKGIV